MGFGSLSLSKGGLTTLAVVALVLTAGACAVPSRENSSLDGTADVITGPGNGEAGSKQVKRKKPWWRLSQYSRKPTAEGSFPGNVRPGRGLASGDEGGIVLLRQGEGRFSDPSKPTKVRR